MSTNRILTNTGGACEKLGVFFFGTRFEHVHEWAQFKEIYRLLKNQYERKDEIIYVFFNYDLPGGPRRNQIDVLLFSKDGPMIIELKSHKGIVTGNENAEWKVKTEDEEISIEDNVYRQLDGQRFALHNKLQSFLSQGVLSADKSFFFVKCCACFEKGSSYDPSQLDFKSRKWFSVITIDDLMDEIYYINSARHWSRMEMESIAKAIGLPKYPPPEKAVELKNWLIALNSYVYPVTLNEYRNSENYSRHFKQRIDGDRNSTMKFEKYFRDKAQIEIEVYFEVIFWKLYSLISSKLDFAEQIANNVDRMIGNMNENKPSEVFSKIMEFNNNPTLINFQNFRHLLGMKRLNGSLVVASTFPAFLEPDEYPMLDSRVISWVNSNYPKHNESRDNQLTRFNSTSPMDGDFQNYMNWVRWCRESAKYLSEKTNIEWRARDVEMAVYSANVNGYELEVLQLP